MNTARRWGLASFLKTNNDPDFIWIKADQPYHVYKLHQSWEFMRFSNGQSTVSYRLESSANVVYIFNYIINVYKKQRKTHGWILEAVITTYLNPKKRTPSKAFLTLNYHLHSAPSPHPPASSIIQYFTKRIVNIRKLLFSRTLGISPAWKEVIAWHSVKNIWDILTSLFMTVLKSEIGQ